MKRDKGPATQQATAESRATQEWIVYEGPHPQIRVTNLPVIGELLLARGVARAVGSAPDQVPAKAAAQLLENGKVVPTSAPAATADEQLVDANAATTDSAAATTQS